MKKIIIILFILVSIGAYIIFKPQTQQSGQAFPDSDADIILFSSQTCPHCQKVEAYIAENNLNSRLKIAKKPVDNNSQNQNLMLETVAKCPEIDSSQGIGVPLAYSVAENKCLYGDTPIINWFEGK
ncbi:hypothetical protein KBB92_00155 [Candidatus Shapirobacteria bacterium]|nr:hypothetical protein [Candidatus Shapirobacteria bacterium]HQI13053.1 hypothetical protein [Candidatus Woesebacteria bacterium]